MIPMIFNAFFIWCPHYYLCFLFAALRVLPICIGPDLCIVAKERTACVFIALEVIHKPSGHISISIAEHIAVVFADQPCHNFRCAIGNGVIAFQNVFLNDELWRLLLNFMSTIKNTLHHQIEDSSYRNEKNPQVENNLWALQFLCFNFYPAGEVEGNGCPSF